MYTLWWALGLEFYTWNVSNQTIGYNPVESINYTPNSGFLSGINPYITIRLLMQVETRKSVWFKDQKLRWFLRRRGKRSWFQP